MDAGDKITVTATPDAGYELTGWTITGASESTPDANNQITATGNVTITATFSKIQYSITNVVKTNGDVSGAGGTLTNWTGVSTVNNVWGAKVGDEISFRADTYQGYQILQENISITDASGNAVSFTFSNNVVTFTMPASNVTITANFTYYRPTVRMAGRFNGRSLEAWIEDSSGPTFSYNSEDDVYTLDVYFTGASNGNVDYFYFRQDNQNLKAANGNEANYGLNEGNVVGTHNLGGGRNFEIIPGVYTFTIKGDLSTLTIARKTPTVTLSPASGSEVEQGTAVSATSTLTGMIAAIQATDSGADGDVTITCNPASLNTVGIGQTVTATAAIGNYSVSATGTYNVVAANTSNEYELTTTLTAGKKYIFMSAESGSGVAMGYQADNNRRGSAEYAITNGKVTINSDVKVFTLEGSETNGWYFNTEDGYLYAASSTNNYLKSETTADDNAKAVISFDGNAATIVFQGNNTRNELRYNHNGGNPIFACYAHSSTTGTNVYFFRQAEPEEKDYTITYADVTGGSATGADGANEGETVTVTVTASEGYAATGITVNPSVEVTDNHDGTYTFTMPASDVTVTPTFVAAYPITYVAEPAAGGLVTGVASAIEGSTVVINVTPNADYQISSVVYSWGTAQSAVNVPIVDGNYQITMPGRDRQLRESASQHHCGFKPWRRDWPSRHRHLGHLGDLHRHPQRRLCG